MVDVVNKTGRAAAQGALDSARAEEMAAAAIARAKASVAGSHIAQKAEKPPSMLERVGNAWNMASMLIMPMAILGGGAKMLAGSKFKWASGATVANKVLTKFGHATDLLNVTSASGATEQVGKIFGETHTVTQNVEKLSSKVSAHANRLAEKSPWAKRAVETLKENTLMNTAFTAGMVVQGGYSLISRRFDQAKTLQQMQYDLTGEKVSKGEASRSSKLHPLVLQARNEMKGTRAKLGNALELAGMLGNLHLMVNVRDNAAQDGMFGRGNLMFMAKSFGFGMLPSLGAKMATAKNTTLQAYHDMYVSIAQTGQADVELYRAVIGGLNPKAPDKLVTELAQKAHEQHFTPKQLMQMLAETDFLSPAKSFAAKVGASRSQPSFRGAAAMSA